MSEPQAPLELGYESAAVEPVGRRPKWVWVVIAIYLLLISLVLLLPLWAKLSSPDESELLVAATITACAIALSGIGLVFTRVRIARRRPITRASLWIPLIASGFLIGGLVIGAAISVIELSKVDENWLWGAWIGGAVVWIDWAVLLWLITRNKDPNSVAARLHRCVLAGSVAELLVAVPCHIVVRRRDECCAGYLTGTGICIGCVVMLVSFGPGVAFLYYRRWKQITGN
jgi:hypothetical protein